LKSHIPADAGGAISSASASNNDKAINQIKVKCSLQTRIHSKFILCILKYHIPVDVGGLVSTASASINDKAINQIKVNSFPYKHVYIQSLFYVF
jgi:hypothetical protein